MIRLSRYRSRRERECRCDQGPGKVEDVQFHFNAPFDSGLFRRIEANPELKRDYENLLKHVPENQRERAKVNIARTLVISQSRAQKQAKNAVGV